MGWIIALSFTGGFVLCAILKFTFCPAARHIRIHDEHLSKRLMKHVRNYRQFDTSNAYLKGTTISSNGKERVDLHNYYSYAPDVILELIGIIQEREQAS